MDKIQLQPDAPLELAFEQPHGITVPSKYGAGEEVRFNTTDGRVLYLPPYPAQKIRDLQLRPAEVFRLTKAHVVNGGKQTVEWRVEKLGAKLGERPDGTFAVPAVRSSIPPQRPETTNGGQVQVQPIQPNVNDLSMRLASTVNMLVDTQATCLEHAKKYNGGVRPEDVRAILLSVYIGMSQRGGRP